LPHNLRNDSIMGGVIGVALRLHAAGWTKVARLIGQVLLVLQPRHVGALALSARIATESGDYAQAERLCLRLVEHDPSDTTALRILGQLALWGSHPERALPFFDAYERLVNGPNTITRVFRQRELDEALARQGVPYHLRVENVLVDTAYWSIMTDTGVVYSRDTHGRRLANSPVVRGRTWDAENSLIASFDRPTVRIEPECIFVGGDDNYSHWLFRNLLKLVSLDRDGLLHALPWLVNEDLRPYQIEYLELLGVAPRDRILVARGQVIRCDALRVPALLTHPQTIRQGIDWLKSRLKAHLTPADQATERIYFSRADVTRRQILNEDALVRALERYGFRTITPGRMSVPDQIRAFSGAAIIVGAHGAGMTNIVFAPARTCVFELTSTPFAHMDDFRRAARAVSQNMTTIAFEPDASQDAKGVQADYCVDVDAVIAHVDRACRSVGDAPVMPPQ
jgi:capsular polysaccharide biosynthesis protein